MLEGSEYRKLILKDGKPLDAKTQKRVDADLDKARAERRRNSFTHHEVSLGDLDLLGRIFDNKVTGEETVLGRRAWRMESEPKSGYKPANKAEEAALAARASTGSIRKLVSCNQIERLFHSRHQQFRARHGDGLRGR